MDYRLVKLRNSLSLVFLGMNNAYGTSKGKKNELSSTGIAILYTSYLRNEPMKMGDISRLYGVSRSTATDYVNHMEKNGYVRRVPGKNKQEICVEPAEKGMNWIADCEERIRAYMETGLARLSPAEQETLSELLLKFVGGGDGTYRRLFDEVLFEQEPGEKKPVTGSHQK